MKEKIIVGISGASGVILGKELMLQIKKYSDVEVHLVYTKAAEKTYMQEQKESITSLHDLADKVYDNENISASIASGTYKTKGMIILPCSMKSVAGIACGYSDTLLLRAADVVIKEHRKLVLGVRECPFSSIHLENMYKLSQMGVVILPTVMSFYQQPDGLASCVRHIAGKCLDQFDISSDDMNRWEG